MKKNRGRLKGISLILIIMLIVSALLTAGVVTYAEYITRSYVKRVVATHEKEGMLFSSNYLLQHTDDPHGNRRVIYSTTLLNSAEATITVCNFSQTDSTKTYDQNIPYTLSAKLVKITSSGIVDVVANDSDMGTKTVTITSGGDDITLTKTNVSDQFNTKTLSKNGSNYDSYTLSFSPDFNNDANGFAVYISAEPSSSLTELKTLDAVFNASVVVAQASNSWDGYFNDQGAIDNSSNPASFDGFNYLVTGTGKGIVTIAWNNTQLELNYICLLKNGWGDPIGTPNVSGPTSSVSFNVDSDTQDRYELQFYYNSSSEIGTWAMVKSYVVFDYVAQTNE